MDVLEEMQFLREGAAENVTKHGSVSPIAFILFENAKVMSPFLGDEFTRFEKDKHMVRTALAAFTMESLYGPCKAIIFVSEAWRIVGKNEALPPSECVDREEAVVVAAQTASGTVYQQTALMLRDGDSVTLGEWALDDEGNEAPLFEPFWYTLERVRADFPLMKFGVEEEVVERPSEN